MTSIPQLRVRSEFSFRKAYGGAEAIAARLSDIGCGLAGMVDVGTWGHTRWESALKKVGVQPAFGREFPVSRGKIAPVAWCLAEDIASFYRFSSSSPKTDEDWAAAKGVIRFAGAALTDPDTFDYVDINPMSVRRTKNALALAAKTNKPIVITGDNNYPGPQDKSAYLAVVDGKKVSPQWILSEDELLACFWQLDKASLAKAVANTYELGDRLAGVSLLHAPMIDVHGDLPAMVRSGLAYRLEKRHIESWTDEYQARLDRELDLIAEKNFASYFIVVADLVQWAKERMLVGPARGSSAGSLVCYLLRITEVDPIVHGLLFERFIDVNRADLPDIDIDFNDQKREQCFAYLADKYGADNVARIGNINTLQPKSVIAEVGKKMGIPVTATFAVKNVLVEHSSGDSRYGNCMEDTLTGTNPGKEFLVKYPEASVMAKVEGTAWHTGVHAAGVMVATHPIIELCSVINGVAQVDKKAAEYLNLLKIDALGLRTLGIIEDCGCITNEELYDLPLDDHEVLGVFNDRKFAGIFQFEGGAQRKISTQIPVKSFRQIDHITALARPGPLGGGGALSYIKRNNGEEPIDLIHPLAEPYIRDTHGVMLYQEQLMFIGRNLGKLSWQEVTLMRKSMSGRKGEEFFNQMRTSFVTGATENGMLEADAVRLWKSMVTFGAWGMNKSHTVSYSIISYWCAHMKRYHGLEYAAACLRNAKDDEQVLELLRELVSEGVCYIPFDITMSEETWSTKSGSLIGGFTNLHGVGPITAARYVQKRATGTLTAADIAKLDACEIKHQELRPAHAMWGAIYNNPSAYNVYGRIKEFADLVEGENCVVICRALKKVRQDENETVRMAKRGGGLKEGQTLFLDIHAVDDSVNKPMRLRIGPRMWDSCGVFLADNLVDGKDWLLVRGRWNGRFSMIHVEKIKCLTNSEIFNREKA